VADSGTAGTGRGFGRVLVFVYGVFALAATGRSTLQLATKASDAPLPYALSAVAASVMPKIRVFLLFTAASVSLR